MTIALLAQFVTSAGMNWLYQFTNNLTNLTTQNGGALTQLGVTELSAIAFFKLVSMVVNWNTSAMTMLMSVNSAMPLNSVNPSCVNAPPFCVVRLVRLLVNW